jgi:hypothetical protein
MGITDIGSQSILWRFQTPLVGSALAQVNAGVLYEGIYHGLRASMAAGATINITAGTCLIFDSSSHGTAAAKLVKIVFGTNFTFNCNSVDKPRYVVARFTWVDATENYADIINTDTVQPYDLVICALEWSGSAVSAVDPDTRTDGFRSAFDKVVLNLMPKVNFSADRSLSIGPGVYAYGDKYITYDGGTVTLDPATDVLGRYDIVGLSSAGNPVVVKGVEGEGPPPLDQFLPVCRIHNRLGAGRLRQTDIFDMRPFLTFAGVLPASAIRVQPGVLSVIPENIGDLSSFLLWLDAAISSAPAVNAAKLGGAEKETELSGSTSTIPTSKAVRDYVDSSVSGLNTAVRTDLAAKGGSEISTLTTRVSYLLSKDVGKVAWFPFNPGDGWIRADGQIITSDTASVLVTKLKAVAGADVSHPFFHLDADKAKVPDLKDRYIKDSGVSGRKIGSAEAGGLVEHSHTVSVQNSNADTHTHGYEHTHNVNIASGGAHTHAVPLATHTHSVTVNHSHGLPNLNHRHHIPGQESIWGHGSTRNTNGNGAGLKTGEPEPGLNGLSTHAAGGTHTTGNGLPGNASSTATSAGSHTHTGSSNSQSKTTTDAATPQVHSHAATTANAGTKSKNDVDNVVLTAYIFAGKFL